VIHALANTLDSIPLYALTPSALIGIVVLLLLTGRLVPRRTLDDSLKREDQWRTAHGRSEDARMVSESARVEMTGQVRELLEHAKTADALIRSIQDVPPAAPDPR